MYAWNEIHYCHGKISNQQERPKGSVSFFVWISNVDDWCTQWDDDVQVSYLLINMKMF